MPIDTKAIRHNLMTEQKNQKTRVGKDTYYDGVMDALSEVERIQNAQALRRVEVS